MEILLIRIELKVVNYFHKKFHLDLSLGLEYAPDITQTGQLLKMGATLLQRGA